MNAVEMGSNTLLLFAFARSLGLGLTGGGALFFRHRDDLK